MPASSARAACSRRSRRCSRSCAPGPVHAASSPTPRTSHARCAAKAARASKADCEASAMDDVLLAVNGTLMRGLELNGNLLAAGARFVREDRTDACYRVWTMDDRHPAMLRTPGEGGA